MILIAITVALLSSARCGRYDLSETQGKGRYFVAG